MSCRASCAGAGCGGLTAARPRLQSGVALVLRIASRAPPGCRGERSLRGERGARKRPPVARHPARASGRDAALVLQGRARASAAMTQARCGRLAVAPPHKPRRSLPEIRNGRRAEAENAQAEALRLVHAHQESFRRSSPPRARVLPARRRAWGGPTATPPERGAGESRAWCARGERPDPRRHGRSRIREGLRPLGRPG
jgi:hypothetical protein